MSTVGGGGGAMYVNVESVDRVDFVDFEFLTTINWKYCESHLSCSDERILSVEGAKLSSAPFSFSR